MNQIDKMLENIMGSSKKKSKSINMFDFSKIVSPIKSTNGASINMQNMWKGFSPMQKNQMRLKFPDSDGDRIPDRFDCSPFNVMRQDTRNRTETIAKELAYSFASMSNLKGNYVKINRRHLGSRPFNEVFSRNRGRSYYSVEGVPRNVYEKLLEIYPEEFESIDVDDYLSIAGQPGTVVKLKIYFE